MQLSASNLPIWFVEEWQRCGVRCSRWAAPNTLPKGNQGRRRKMGHFTLYAFTAGAATLSHGNKVLAARAGFSWLLPPGWTFRMQTRGMQKCHWLEVQLELLLDRTLDVHPLYQLQLPAEVENPSNISSFIDFFTEISDRPRKDPAYDLLTRHQADALLGHYLLTGFAAGSLRLRDSLPTWLEEVTTAIHNRPIQERTTIVSIAEELGIGVSTIQHGLRRHLGRSFTQLIKEKRIARAHHLLESHKGFTVANVATRCGYRSVNLFYTHYRELVGHSPRTRVVGEKPEDGPL